MYWEKLDIHGQRKFLKLMYSKPADMLIAHFQSEEEDNRKCIFIRSKNNNNYKKISINKDNISYDDPVCRFDNKILYFNAWRYLSTGIFWDGIYKIDLITDQTSLVCNQETIANITKYDIDVIANIIDMSSDGSKLLLKIGIKSSKDTGYINYYLAEYDIDSANISTDIALIESAL